jgi:hypothetical protein
MTDRPDWRFDGPDLHLSPAAYKRLFETHGTHGNGWYDRLVAAGLPEELAFEHCFPAPPRIICNDYLGKGAP